VSLEENISASFKDAVLYKRQVDDLAMLVRGLVHDLQKLNPDSSRAKKAMDYLKRKNLTGSILR
jgi:hypothetical protein